MNITSTGMDAVSPERGVERSKAALRLVLASAFLDALALNLLLPIMPFFALSMNATALQITALYTAFAAAGLFTAPLYARIIRSRGVAVSFKIGFALSIIGLIVTAFAGSYAVLLVGRVLTGLGSGKLVSAQSVAARGDRATRTARLGAISAAVGTGVILGPTFGALSSFLGPTATILLAAAINAVALIVLAASPLGSAGKPPEQAASPTPHAAAEPKRLSSYLILVVAMLLAFSLQSVIPVTALWTHAHFGWGVAQVGLLLAWCGAAGVATQLALVPKLARSMSSRMSLAVGAALAAFSLVAIVATGAILVTIAGLAVLSVGIGLANTSANAILSLRSASAADGLASGQMARGIGQIGAPMLAGLLFQSVNIDAPYLFAIGCLISIAVLSPLAHTSHGAS